MELCLQRCLYHTVSIKKSSPILFYTGILDFEEDDEDDENDEILRELRAKQAELKAVCQHNLLATKKLYKLAKDEMAKQELKKKLAVSDTEVCML